MNTNQNEQCEFIEIAYSSDDISRAIQYECLSGIRANPCSFLQGNQTQTNPMIILFLDFDGVLHPRTPAGKFFSNLHRLESVLRDFQNVEIVISSSWREFKGFDQLKEIFSEDIRHRVIGVTPIHDFDPFTEFHGSRLREVMDYLNDHDAKTEWLALDDEENLYHPDCPNLIKCQTKIGLDEQAEQELRSRLMLITGQ